MKLKLLISEGINPFLNVAIENFLLANCHKNSVIMYLWRNHRTVVIGKNQNPFLECNLDKLQGEGGYLMRRTTGGGAVYHDEGNLNFSFIAPADLYDQEKQFEVLKQALQKYDIKCEVSGRNDVLCYDKQGQARKFSGNAFVHHGQNRLHHGTILIKSNIEDLQKYLLVKPMKLKKHGVESVKSRVVNLSELAEVSAENIIPCLIEAFSMVYGEEVEMLDFSEISQNPEVKNLETIFQSDNWRFARWRDFQTTISQQFAWGLVEIFIAIDQGRGLISDIKIATDSLNTEISTMAEDLLIGKSSQQRPSPPKDFPNEISDILDMIY